MKKQLILLILKILETETDVKHPLTQIEIAKVISEIYDGEAVIRYKCELNPEECV